MKKNRSRGKLCALATCMLVASCDSIFSSYLVYPDGGELGTIDPNAPVCGDRDLLLCLRFEDQLTDESPKHFEPLDPPPDVSIFRDIDRGLVGSFGLVQNPKPFRLKHDPDWEVTKYSFDAWVFPTKGPDVRYRLIDRSQRFGVFLYSQATSSLWMACGIHDKLASGPTVPIGTWSHIACVVSASKVEFYLDGKLTQSVPFLSVSPVSQTIQTFVGAKEPEGSEAFIGMLDELRLFKRLRTAAEIEADAARDPRK